VPNSANPQTLNRYAYVNNNPLRYTDPSGHSSGAECAAMSDPWQSQWCWNNRWYEARGLFWDPVKGGWSVPESGRPAKFGDEQILSDVLHELGIVATSRSPGWTIPQLTLVAQGVVALANKVGWVLLRSLLPSQTAFVRAPDSEKPFWIAGEACNCELGILGAIVTFFDGAFNHNEAWVRGLAVHELGHVIDFKDTAGILPFTNFSSKLTPEMSGYWFNNYSRENALGVEFFAEALAAWVYDSPDQNPYLKQTPGFGGFVPTQVIDWLRRILGVQS